MENKILFEELKKEEQELEKSLLAVRNLMERYRPALSGGQSVLPVKTEPQNGQNGSSVRFPIPAGISPLKKSYFHAMNKPMPSQYSVTEMNQIEKVIFVLRQLSPDAARLQVGKRLFELDPKTFKTEKGAIKRSGYHLSKLGVLKLIKVEKGTGRGNNYTFIY